APLDVELDRHDPLVVDAPDALRTIHDLDPRELRERDERPARCRDEEALEARGRAPEGRLEALDDRVDLVVLVERRRRGPRHGLVDRVLDLLDGHAVAGARLAVD